MANVAVVTATSSTSSSADNGGIRAVCPVCGAQPQELVGEKSKNALICGQCKHSFVGILPTDEELAAIYKTYGYDDDEGGRYSPPFLDAIISDLISTFASYRKTNKLLDVGFGAGGLLRIAKKQGWDPHGVELSSEAVAYGRSRDLGTLHEGDYLTLPLELGSFDVIIMSELIEHVTDPMPFLRRSAELLRPGGLLYMTTPHGRGVSGRALKAGWSVLRPPEHLQLFSIESMRRSVKQAGFSRVEIFTQGLLPHELVAKLKAKIRPAPKAPAAAAPEATTAAEPGNPNDFPERARKAVDFNENLSQKRLGRMFKGAANAILKVTDLGDGLRVRAER